MDKGWYKILAPVSIIYSLLHKKHHTTLWTKKNSCLFGSCICSLGRAWAEFSRELADSTRAEGTSKMINSHRW